MQLLSDNNKAVTINRTGPLYTCIPLDFDCENRKNNFVNARIS